MQSAIVETAQKHIAYNKNKRNETSGYQKEQSALPKQREAKAASDRNKTRSLHAKFLREMFLLTSKVSETGGKQCRGKLLLKVMHNNIALLPKKSN